MYRNNKMHLIYNNKCQQSQYSTYKQIPFTFLIISIIFGIPVFHDYFKTGLVEKFPTLIFSGFILMVSLIMYAIGVILEVVAKKHRQLFELFLINTKKEK